LAIEIDPLAAIGLSLAVSKQEESAQANRKT
jgi:hypothetical protein